MISLQYMSISFWTASEKFETFTRLSYFPIAFLLRLFPFLRVQPQAAFRFAVKLEALILSHIHPENAITLAVILDDLLVFVLVPVHDENVCRMVNSVPACLEPLRLGNGPDITEDLPLLFHGRPCPQGLLSFPDTAARKRTDLTPLLLGLAILLFVFDVAQRRLDLFREAPEKAEKEEKLQKEHSGKKAERKPKQEEQAPDAADVLWQSLKNKKRM